MMSWPMSSTARTTVSPHYKIVVSYTHHARVLQLTILIPSTSFFTCVYRSDLREAERELSACRRALYMHVYFPPTRHLLAWSSQSFLPRCAKE